MKFAIPALIAISGLLSNCKSDSSHENKAQSAEDQAGDKQKEEQSKDSSLQKKQVQEQHEQKEGAEPKDSKKPVAPTEPTEHTDPKQTEPTEHTDPKQTEPTDPKQTEPTKPTDPKQTDPAVKGSVTLVDYSFGVPAGNEILGKIVNINEGLRFYATIKSDKKLSLVIEEAAYSIWPERSSYKTEIELKSEEFENYLNAVKSLSNAEIVSEPFDPTAPICRLSDGGYLTDRSSLSIASGYDAKSNKFTGGLTLINKEQVCWHSDYTVPKQEQKKKEVASFEQKLQNALVSQFAAEYTRQSAAEKLESVKKNLSKASAIVMTHTGMGINTKYTVDFAQKTVVTFRGTQHPDYADQHNKFQLTKGLEGNLRAALVSLDVNLPNEGTCNLSDFGDNRTIEVVFTEQNAIGFAASYFIVAGETGVESLCGLSNRVFRTTDEGFRELEDIVSLLPGKNPSVQH